MLPATSRRKVLLKFARYRRKFFLEWLNKEDTDNPQKISLKDQSLETIEFPDDGRPVHLDIRVNTKDTPIYLTDATLRTLNIATSTKVKIQLAHCWIDDLTISGVANPRTVNVTIEDSCIDHFLTRYIAFAAFKYQIF